MGASEICNFIQIDQTWELHLSLNLHIPMIFNNKYFRISTTGSLTKSIFLAGFSYITDSANVFLHTE
jgi:hypothetical protein